MLVNHAYTIAERILRGTDHRLFASDKRLPFIGEINSRYHIHKSGFPASVFAENRQNLAVVNGEIHVFIRNRRAEAFRNAPHFQRNLFFHAPPP